MDRAAFERALLCVWDRAAGTGLLAGWEERLDPAATPTGELTLALDVHPERSSAAIAVAGGGAVEVVDHRPGTGWIAGRVLELVDRHRIARVVRDRAGPAGATILEAPGLQLYDATAAEVAAACAWLVDAIRDDGLDLRPHPALTGAFAGARAVNRGDGQAIWVRRSADADLTPLYAVTLAGWHAAVAPPPPSSAAAANGSRGSAGTRRSPPARPRSTTPAHRSQRERTYHGRDGRRARRALPLRAPRAALQGRQAATMRAGSGILPSSRWSASLAGAPDH